MRGALLVAIVGLLATPLQAQDDPLETHLYNVEFLTVSTQDFPGEALGLETATIGAMVAVSEMDRSLLSGEDLIKLIKSNVAEDTWEHVSSLIGFSNGILTVTNKRSVHDKIVQYLNYWRGFFGKMISIDAALFSVDPQLLARVRAAGNADRPSILPPEHLRQLLEAAREGKFAELLKTMRVTAHPGQRVSLQELAKQQYVRDYDVQIATAAVTLDPIPDVLVTGSSVDVRPFIEPFTNGITLEVRADTAEVDSMEERKLKIAKELVFASPFETEGKVGGTPKAVPTPVLTEQKLQLPHVTHDRVRTMLTVRNRESVIVGSVLRKNRQLLFVLTPAIVAADEKPTPEPVFEEQRLLRLFDISPLTRKVQDWSGPKLNLVGPRGGGGGPLTGATFTLEEPAALMTSSDVASMIKTRIAPDSWGNKRNSIDDTERGTLIIRQKPDVLRDIEKFLTTILTARAQMITTEAVVIGFKKGARGDWERDVPALAPGGYFVEAEKFDKLLEEAYKGQKVRLVESAEVTCFPQQRVHVLRSLQDAYVADYEPQVSSFATMQDPIVDSFTSGFVLDVRPHFIHGNEQISVAFQSALAVGQIKEVEALAPPVTPLQAVQARILRWNANVLCARGKYSLVAIETVGRGDDAEDLAVFVRARQNVLK